MIKFVSLELGYYDLYVGRKFVLRLRPFTALILSLQWRLWTDQKTPCIVFQKLPLWGLGIVVYRAYQDYSFKKVFYLKPLFNRFYKRLISV